MLMTVCACGSWGRGSRGFVSLTPPPPPMKFRCTIILFHKVYKYVYLSPFMPHGKQVYRDTPSPESPGVTPPTPPPPPLSQTKSKFLFVYFYRIYVLAV